MSFWIPCTSAIRCWISPRNSRRRVRKDAYFIDHNLYPNVDFYSGIVLRAIGIPTNMFTVMFAIGRLPGWIAQWKESMDDPKWKICRPRQIYTGAKEYDFVPIHARG
jgi:citrate synthase